MPSSGETLGSPWPPLAIRPFNLCGPCHQPTSHYRLKLLQFSGSNLITEHIDLESTLSIQPSCGRLSPHPGWPEGGIEYGAWGGDGGLCLPSQFCWTINDFIPQHGLHGHERMARGGHELPKVSPEPAMPYSSIPYGRATPETALRPFQGWAARRTGGLRTSFIPLNTPRHLPK
jgi:hypothetical protein